jgi:hypothetical protein
MVRIMVKNFPLIFPGYGGTVDNGTCVAWAQIVDL